MTVRVGALPMYDADRAAVQSWWNALAAAMRRHGIADVPDAPSWPDDLQAHWADPRLLLSQTCGAPLMTRLRDRVQVVGAWRYTAPGCNGIHYRSELVVRADDPARCIDDLRDRVVAVNDPGSHSGCNAMRSLVAPLSVGGRFFGRAIVSGSHRASLALVRDGRADIAAIDCVSLAGFASIDAVVWSGLRALGHTADAPGLPLITARHTPADALQALRQALDDACADPALAATRAALFIGGFEVAEVATWQVIDELRRDAAARGVTAL